jgi:S1-C subfamily serine protease
MSAVKSNASFSKYKKVYVLNFKDDPRKVIPKVVNQFKKLGLEVVLTKEGEPVGGTQGTGYIINADGYVLTAAHVLNHEKTVTVWVNKVQYEAEVIYKEEDDKEEDSVDNNHLSLQKSLEKSLNSKNNQSIAEFVNNRDLALLKIISDKKDFPTLVFSKSPAYVMGQQIYTLGFPLSNILGDTPRLNQGVISSAVGIKDNDKFIQISAEVQPGNSGGPLLSQDGKVTGMIVMSLRQGQNINFALKSEHLKEFINNANKKAKIGLNLNYSDKSSLENVQEALVQIRSGRISPEFKKEPKLVCSFRYEYLWDMWNRFALFDLSLFDWDTDEILLRAGQYGDNPMTNENSTIDNVFREIKNKLNL